jgi:hypothetical protein
MGHPRRPTGSLAKFTHTTVTMLVLVRDYSSPTTAHYAESQGHGRGVRASPSHLGCLAREALSHVLDDALLIHSGRLIGVLLELAPGHGGNRRAERSRGNSIVARQCRPKLS